MKTSMETTWESRTAEGSRCRTLMAEVGAVTVQV